jgi:hypothetical protein
MLRVGFARIDITPPIGCCLQGHFVRIVSTAVHDPLYANAVYIDDGKTQACIVSCDLLAIGRGAVEQSRQLIHEQVGIAARNAIICATHTHTGPVVHERDRAADRNDPSPQWFAALPQRIASAVAQARHNAEPTSIATAIGQEQDVSFGRRYLRKDGSIVSIAAPGDPSLVKALAPIDPQLGVVAFGNDYHDLSGVLLNFALHLDTIDGTLISADFPGVIREQLTRAFDRDLGFVYTSGAMANINHYKSLAPPRWQGYYECARRTGMILAGEAIKTVARLDSFTDDAPLRVASREVVLPLRQYDHATLEQARAIVKDAGPGNWGGFTEALGPLNAADLGRDTFTTEINALGVGDVGFVTIPGEYFVELGLEIKQRSPFKHTFIIELAGDCLGYICTQQAYGEGGYEAQSSGLAPGAGELLAREAVALLQSIH